MDMKTTTKTAGAVRLLHMTKGWRFWGFDVATGEDVGDWSTLDEAIAAMEAAGFSGVTRISDNRATFEVRS